MDEQGMEENLSKKMTAKKENPFFPESRPISEEDFGRLPRDVSFVFNMAGRENPWTAEIKIRNGQSRIAVEFPFDVREKLEKDSLEQFFIQKNGQKMEYPVVTDNHTHEQNTESSDTGEYYIDKLRPRKLEIDRSKIENLDVERVSELIKQTNGENLVFYSGAGISMGGERPVWGMSELWKELGLKGDGDEYTRVFRNPKEYPPSELLTKVNEFKKQLFEDVSTPAHIAITEIVNAKNGAIVFTENVDLKHEAEGSRLAAVHMDSDDDDFLKVKLRSSSAKILVTVGLSADDRAVIQYMKQQNPELIIVAFTLSEETIPKYLDENDVVVLGDVQEILPKVAEKVKKIK